jgi:hypothetical protein
MAGVSRSARGMNAAGNNTLFGQGRAMTAYRHTLSIDLLELSATQFEHRFILFTFGQIIGKYISTEYRFGTLGRKKPGK